MRTNVSAVWSRRAHGPVGQTGASMPWELAQVNVARLRAALGDPRNAGFVAGVVPVNRLAEQADGFVWRQRGAHDDIPTVSDGDDRLVVNLSTWRSYEDLHRFVYRTAHGGYVRRRRRWFERSAGPSTALWWVPAGDRPTIPHALERLAHLRMHGPSPFAFTVRVRSAPTAGASPGAGTAPGPDERDKLPCRTAHRRGRRDHPERSGLGDPRPDPSTRPPA